MTEREARARALRDMVNILGTVNSQINGLAPMYATSSYLSDKEKKLVRREWDKIVWSLNRRLYKAEQ